IPAGGSCNLRGSFKPAATGARSATVTVTSNATNSPTVLSLQGTGIAPATTFNPANVPFGNQAVGSTSAATHVHIMNSGTATLNITGITLTGTNPTEFSLTSAADGATAACPLGASALNAGSTCNVDAKFAPASTGAKSANISVADDAAGSPQTVPLSGTGVAPDLMITKTHAGNFTVNMSGTFTITVSNVGTAPSSGLITVSDTLPNGLAFITGSGTIGSTNWSCPPPGQPVTCTNTASLAVGANSVITLTVSVGNAALPSVMNTARVSDPGDGNPNGADKSSTDTVTVNQAPAPDLAMAKTDNGPFTRGTNGTYTLKITNQGTLATSGTITVSDPLPIGLSFISGTGTGWSCSTGGTQVVTCTNPNSIGIGANSTITLTVSVNAPAGTVTNTATVSDPNDGNPNGADKSSTDMTTVNNPAPTLTSISPTNALVGQAISPLTLTGTNFIQGVTVVNFNGNPDTGGAVSNNGATLTINIPGSQLAAAGAVNVSATNPAPGGGTSANQTFTINNPAPTLTSISPTAGNVGQAISMTLTGTGYNSTSTVKFGTMVFTGGTVTNNGTTLAVNIPGTALGAVGSVPVTVTNPTPGGGTSLPQTFTISDFSVSSPTGEQTVTAGGMAQFTIAVGTQGGTLANDVTFAASNLPPATTATFNPMSFAKGSNAGNSTLTLQTTGHGAVPPQGAPRPPQPRVVLWLVAGMLALLSLMLMRRGVRVRRLAFYLPLALLVLSAAIIAGCRGGGPSGTPAGMYSVTVTATSGGVAKMTTVTLQVN
ncbi:MAG TPA: choice-of-anchor D domain-containing protein, partial [Candidatus Acidoferrales bacterium]|nr:choice-of-anchor D domain-containing protein [Candidatus Acidoferrales bacterium]